MITFTKLGNLGRLGNQLLQIAGTIGICYLKSKYGHLLEANCCSISVRRGDYLLAQHRYPILSMNYYNRAMTWILKT